VNEAVLAPWNEGESGPDGRVSVLRSDPLWWERRNWIHWIFPAIVSSERADETFLLRDETILRFWRRGPETADGYHVAQRDGGHCRPRI